MTLLAFLQPASAKAESLTLCIEVPSKAAGTSAIENQFRELLLQLNFANVDERKLPLCSNPKEYRLLGLKVRKQDTNLIVSGSLYRPGSLKMIGPGEVSCTDCSTQKDGVDQALGHFLNRTLFDWNSRLMGGFRIESCARQRNVLFTTLTLLGQSPISNMEMMSYGFGELFSLDRKVELLKPVAIAVDLFTPPSEILEGKAFDAKFKRNKQFTDRELGGFVVRYCSNFKAEYQRLLVPVYKVDLDYEDYILTQAADYLHSSSSITPSGSVPK